MKCRKEKYRGKVQFLLLVAISHVSISEFTLFAFAVNEKKTKKTQQNNNNSIGFIT